jgi:hypothetical protein
MSFAACSSMCNCQQVHSDIQQPRQSSMDAPTKDEDHSWVDHLNASQRRIAYEVTYLGI